MANARQVNPRLECLALSTVSGEGFDAWLDWLERECGKVAAGTTGGDAAVAASVGTPAAAPPRERTA
jgi:hypothetical protein